MKILLNQDVRKLGKKGEIVEVSDGYGRNYLLPQHLGVEATKSVINEWESKKGSAQVQAERARQEAIELGKQITGKTVKIVTKAGAEGKLFGTITPKEVADALKAQIGVEVDKKKIVMPDAVKKTGEYEFSVRLHADSVPKLKLIVEGCDA